MDRLPSDSPKPKDSKAAQVRPAQAAPEGFWAKWTLRSQADDYLKAIRKQRIYNSDRIPAAQLREVLAFEEELGGALKRRETARYAPLMEKGEEIAVSLFPVRGNDWLRENVEVAFVAIAAALALRAFFLQPFKIPTDSMKPTLYGIQTVKVDAASHAKTSFLGSIWRQLVFGESDGLIVLDHPARITDIQGGSLTPWFDYTDILFDTGETRRAWITKDAVTYKLGLAVGQRFEAGEPVLSYRNSAGDQVFVDKFSFNFRLPKRGEVFVFRTNGIRGIEDDMARRGIFTSQFYIKRCVGLPGDTLRLIPPLLEINGVSEGATIPWAIRRVEAAQDGYRGYGYLNSLVNPPSFLRGPAETYSVEPDTFWAMGDNSYNSQDSRFWGAVPRENTVGVGLVVYWPFGARWGLIR
ncbi:signal peptidase I [Verrucomicrobium sp. GAS474]|uniref:signal peptidase I n=1 Tax=Verrucomicrobium sp. GAS474 TaxID=1882831 RepID=UPI00087D7D54|nr:signal peptidase I [Verrucomicrobium sp. GAS474]SDU27132.1 signal peptidase I [Verrucomicrobium sp. GAS474]